METGKELRFSTRAEFQAQLRLCIPKAQLRLRLFDPDFAHWPLNAPDVAQALRQFLLANRSARLELATHTARHLQTGCPRFMQLLADFSHAVECRVTPARLAQLTDSFCIADGAQVVRRFHCDHFRGAAAFDAPAEAAIPIERFAAIWDDSRPGLFATTLGL